VTGELRVARESADGADLGEELRGRDRSTAREIEQRRRERSCPLFELLIELGDLAAEPPAS
jgi:hypothetical protein